MFPREAAVIELVKTHRPPPSATALLWTLAAHCDASGRCWPGQDCLAACAGLSVRAVRDGLRFWRGAGVLEATQGRGRSVRAGFVIPSLAGAIKPANPAAFQAGKPANPAAFEDRKTGKFCREKPADFAGKHLKREHTRARAREGDPEGRVAAWAERLAGSVARGGERALILAEWRAPDVARIAIERHGADPETLRRAGCEVPPDLRRRADG